MLLPVQMSSACKSRLVSSRLLRSDTERNGNAARIAPWPRPPGSVNYTQSLRRRARGHANLSMISTRGGHARSCRGGMAVA